MKSAPSSSILRVGTTESVSGLQGIYLVWHEERLPSVLYYRLIGQLLLSVLDLRMCS